MSPLAAALHTVTMESWHVGRNWADYQFEGEVATN